MKNFNTVLFFCFSCILVSGTSYSKSLTPSAGLNGGNYAKLSKPDSDTPFVIEQLRGDLYAFNDDGTLSLEDGTLVLYSPAYSDSVNWIEDAKKMTNFAENLAMVRDGQLLAIEKRKPIGATDTVFYNMTQMLQEPYQLLFTTTGLNHPGLIGIVQDSYTGTATPIDLNGITAVNFAITSDAASANPNRFRLVFTSPLTLSGIVPVTYSSATAWQQNNAIAVQWKMENELNVSKYEVERSSDGINFSVAASIAYSGKSSSIYNWTDTKPLAGNNFYRIKEISANGQVQYSKILKVSISKAEGNITVYPNPAVSGTVGLQMNNMAAGNYTVHILNNSGQLIFSKLINHTEGSSTETITVGQSAGKGVYRMEVIHPDNNISNINVVF
jgi:hypothetical protein